MDSEQDMSKEANWDIEDLIEAGIFKVDEGRNKCLRNIRELRR